MATFRNVIGLSGGKDSTVLAFMLKERESDTEWEYITTPTGDEGPEMVEHWLRLEETLGKPLIRITNPKAPNLDALIDIQGMMPNFRARFCTRMLKIEPTIAWCIKNSPVLLHVGLRADESEREGIYGDHVQSRFPFREWGIGLAEVLSYLPFLEQKYGIVIPVRTDCLNCYHQRIGEWWNYWDKYPTRFYRMAEKEKAIGGTLRSPGRDTWPVALEDLGAEFARLKERGARDFFETSNMRRVERGGRPLLEKPKLNQDICRVCTL